MADHDKDIKQKTSLSPEELRQYPRCSYCHLHFRSVGWDSVLGRREFEIVEMAERGVHRKTSLTDCSHWGCKNKACGNCAEAGGEVNMASECSVCYVEAGMTYQPEAYCHVHHILCSCSSCFDLGNDVGGGLAVPMLNLAKKRDTKAHQPRPQTNSKCTHFFTNREDAMELLAAGKCIRFREDKRHTTHKHQQQHQQQPAPSSRARCHSPLPHRSNGN